jgi:acyl-CoA thioester hydrolase
VQLGWSRTTLERRRQFGHDYQGVNPSPSLGRAASPTLQRATPAVMLSACPPIAKKAMARIQIEIPEQFPFATEVDLYLSHMNYGGHLDNALLLTLVSEARVRFFQSLGYSELNVDGVGIIVADAAVQYRSEAFHGEVMVVRMAAVEFSKYGCDLLWCMNEQTSGREVARGKTGIVFFDYAARKVTPVPEKFRAHFAA